MCVQHRRGADGSCMRATARYVASHSNRLACKARKVPCVLSAWHVSRASLTVTDCNWHRMGGSAGRPTLFIYMCLYICSWLTWPRMGRAAMRTARGNGWRRGRRMPGSASAAGPQTPCGQRATGRPGSPASCCTRWAPPMSKARGFVLCTQLPVHAAHHELVMELCCSCSGRRRLWSGGCCWAGAC